ncbi:MAG: TetR family transcriptional regulator [Amycolatopsis sp.]|jgi:AcrR family transcriptional regulator|uniref:TetR/AcrR family transcriptional regulator n=1 Tax=Amycolatopsis sp. TaxID=37632 RepID=UPI0026073347|nr:TetR family transcriptional regulator [Amycolatopsis sp.]MCU1683928.1 TetR family transcriptional regulator [Amycolatopsis sp.]
MADELTEEQPVGRRERKLQQTRSSLTRSALELFAERGFDAVTVVDIANRSDVDPSTFFRHFRSKESLLFTDMDSYVETARPLLNERPADESLIESLRAVNLHLSENYDYDLENLRAELSESSAELHAQVVIHRERMVVALTQLIGERLGIDSQSDPRPYLAATVWESAFGWYRHRKVSTHRRVKSTVTAVNEIVDIVQSANAIFHLRPDSSAA